MELLRVAMMTVLCFGCSGKNATVSFQPLTVTGSLQCPNGAGLLFQDAIAWQRFWLQYCKTFDGSGALAPAPVVDFDKQTVVGIFIGQRPSGGYGVTIKDIKKTKSGLQVSIVEHKPNPGDIVITMITYPYALVTIEKTVLPLEVITLTRGK